MLAVEQVCRIHDLNYRDHCRLKQRQVCIPLRSVMFLCQIMSCCCRDGKTLNHHETLWLKAIQLDCSCIAVLESPKRGIIHKNLFAGKNISLEHFDWSFINVLPFIDCPVRNMTKRSIYQFMQIALKANGHTPPHPYFITLMLQSLELA